MARRGTRRRARVRKASRVRCYSFVRGSDLKRVGPLGRKHARRYYRWLSKTKLGEYSLFRARIHHQPVPSSPKADQPEDGLATSRAVAAKRPSDLRQQQRGDPRGERVTMATIHHGDALTVLRTLPDQSARCCVTSPPYWGLRDYGMAGQLGLEPTPDAYVARMVEVFREVRRVLADDGTLWLNLGDSYAAGGKGGGGSFMAERADAAWQKQSTLNGWKSASAGMKSKDLVGIPWMVAFALRADGWYLRSDIIWAKPNPMPESVTDRPTKSHEYLFLLSKSARYYYDAAAIAEDLASGPSDRRKMAEALDRFTPNEGDSLNAANPAALVGRKRAVGGQARRRSGNKERDIPCAEDGRGIPNNHLGRGIPWEDDGAGRNARTVWTIPTQPYTGAHFATFPEELARRCIVAGSAPGDTVLDPFGGSGTVGQVATGNARNALLIELNPAYVELARQRIGSLLCEVA